MKLVLVLGVFLCLAAGCGGGAPEPEAEVAPSATEDATPSPANVDVGMDLRQVMEAAGPARRVSPGADGEGHCPCTVWYYGDDTAEIWFDQEGLVWKVETHEP
jgi:hypothetical protein